MTLKADAVDLGAILFDKFDDVLCAGGFGARRLNVIIVVVEFRGGVGGRGGCEGNGDVGGADGSVEDVLAVGAVFVEGFIHNIPVIALAFVVGHFVRDVVLHDIDEGGVIEAAIGDCMNC